MTPKTQYQKMRDNRARRESIDVNTLRIVDVELPKNPKVGEVVRVHAGAAANMRVKIEQMSTVLEDGSVLTASGPLQNDPHHELRKTWAPGQRWQRREPGRDWVDTVKPSWLENVQYRRHPSDIDQEKPWYPDNSSEWVEVPDDCMECPVPKHVVVEVLKAYEREDKNYAKQIRPAKGWTWDWPADTDERNVAYKVVA